MRFGFHISIAQGFSRVVDKAQKTNCETIQLFSRNPRGWKYNDFAAAKEELYTRSINSLCEDLKRAEILGIPFLVVHVGNRVTLNEEEAIEKVAKGINESLQRVSNQVMILLENTAGQGTELGSTFSQLQGILSGVKNKKRIGICLDTAHAFAAGYDLSNRKGLDETLSEFDRLIGLKHLHLLHLNDSKTPLASHSDRHWHIGKGHIGLEGFRNIVNHPLLNHLPGIMETPRKDPKDDLRNMRVMRSLMKK